MVLPQAAQVRGSRVVAAIALRALIVLFDGVNAVILLFGESRYAIDCCGVEEVVACVQLEPVARAARLEIGPEAPQVGDLLNDLCYVEQQQRQRSAQDDDRRGSDPSRGRRSRRGGGRRRRATASPGRRGR